eukprot:CAMPEP_0194244600 /NCGR_PEP_ID=MMETSP0158-20130606/11645_1 /TAXON_ID=33649 /ORGANISM="Thalassionema nitzschioides, Strain L26-B" /LENGTH=230 /DNA_ID=CAMNT_0038980145 /DNA_START=148 /DNA_END=836 /DNA_ORIENTATION=-
MSSSSNGNDDIPITTVQECIEFVKQNKKGMLHSRVKPWLEKNDRRVVLAGVSKYGIHLAHTVKTENNNCLRNDKQIVLVAVQQNGHALKFASEGLKQDPDVVMKAVQQSGQALQYASLYLRRNNKAIVLAAVRQNGKALEHAGPLLREKEEIVLEAVRQNKAALQFAGPSCRSNTLVIIEVVRQDPGCLKFSSSLGGLAVVLSKESSSSRQVPVFCDPNKKVSHAIKPIR